jgi:plastocyanin
VATRRWILALVAAVALVGAACGSEEPATDPGDDTGGGDTSIDLTAVNFGFSPTSFEVEGGAEITVNFTNEDDTQHSFTAADVGADLTLEGGSSDTTTFTAPASGEIEFVCKFHNTMKGTITVAGTSAGGGGSEDSGSDQSDDLDY